MSRQEIVEAIKSERARCCWVLDQVLLQLEAQLQRKLLIEAERHLIETKLKIARSLVHHAKTGIVLNFKPGSPPVGPFTPINPTGPSGPVGDQGG